ncbi:hypothetical protein R50073_24380 [Maricurvus nonylphenolicus]|uniref:hypothetical protein n=1 Tax=Maricurvus nonylphenolicus TaxID=1008307 RepID=UPI0036F27E38
MTEATGTGNATKLKSLNVSGKSHKDLRLALIKHDRKNLREVTEEAIADWIAKMDRQAEEAQAQQAQNSHQ